MPGFPRDKGMAQEDVRIGTSSWSAQDWVGPFYPPGTKAADFLRIYAEHFDTVECDATFYAIPAETTVAGWVAKTPEDFLFCAKLPREITHDRELIDCGEVVEIFTGVMRGLGNRLGPLVAQFPYFAKGKDAEEFLTGARFLNRLRGFLDIWPEDVELVVEIRNAHWLKTPLVEELRARNIGLVLPDIYTMPRPGRIFAGPDPVTAKTIYVRFLGHHRQMDSLVQKLIREGKRTGEWDSLAVDRTKEMREWVAPLKKEALEGHKVRVYFNNHYAGYAPGSIEAFRQIWDEVTAG